MNLYTVLFNKLFRNNMSVKEVIFLLNSLLDKNLSTGEWDYFISVKNSNPDLELIRMKMQNITGCGSKFMNTGSISPTNLNNEGAIEVRKILAELTEEAGKT